MLISRLSGLPRNARPPASADHEKRIDSFSLLLGGVQDFEIDGVLGSDEGWSNKVTKLAKDRLRSAGRELRADEPELLVGGTAWPVSEIEIPPLKPKSDWKRRISDLARYRRPPRSTMPTPVYLTNSRYAAGPQCLRRSWLDVPQGGDWSPPELGSAEDIGLEIARMARLLFSSGVLVADLTWQHTAAFARTRPAGRPFLACVPGIDWSR